MKLPDLSWRSKVGCFNSSWNKLTKSEEKCLFESSFQIVFATLVLLLIIGGVELNPGPPVQNMTVRDIHDKKNTINVTQQAQQRNNFTTENSMWGNISLLLAGINDLATRTFIHECNGLATDEKYMDTPVYQIIDIASQLQLDLNASGNHPRFVKSVWGQLALQIYGSNTGPDRNFLHGLWAAYTNYEGQSESSQTTPSNLEKRKRSRTARKIRWVNDRLTQSTNTVSNLLASGLRRLGLSNPSTSTFDDAVPQPQPSTQLLIDEFNKAVSLFITEICEICHKQIFKSQSRVVTIGPIVREMLSKFNMQVQLNQSVRMCTRCHSNLTKTVPQIPPQALCNHLKLEDLPACIRDLNDNEIHLIKQVKPFLKIINLNKGRGQKGLQGMTIHFPQDVEDLVEQLPLSINNTDVIFVSEEHEKTDFKRTLLIRPDKLMLALHFLKENNGLYTNIQLVPRTEQELEPTVLRSNPNPVEPILDVFSGNAPVMGYVEIAENRAILRATIHQANPIFGISAGNQCTAMCAAFLSHCHIENPLTWTREIVDHVLTTGNTFYNERRAVVPHNLLAVDDLIGVIQCFENVRFTIEVSLDVELNLQGYLNRYPLNALPSLTEQLSTFISSGSSSAIITTNGYSMALFVSGNQVFYFDSHSRGSRGASATSGTACVIKYTNPDATPSCISSLVHRNCQPKGNAVPTHDTHYFTITAMIINPIAENAISESSDSSGDEANAGPTSPTKSPARKKHRQFENMLEDTSSDSSEDEEPEMEDNLIQRLAEVREFGGDRDMDCMIVEDDFVEPHMEDYDPKQTTLKRRQRLPLSDAIEQNLELLSFPHLFPFGKNGINEKERLIKITPLDYYQARLMSAYKRFSGNTEYLFYSLNECDRFRAFQKISVCCNMRKEAGQGDLDDDELINPHLYMSAVRGSHSYWKKYAGDLIAMIKTIGIPTFFLTFSFDDLNSWDVVNALYKAKHGVEVDNIEPSSLPFAERSELLNDFPIVAARHFSMRLTKFLAFLQKNSTAIFGKRFADFSVRIEFQARGSPHAHMLIWLQDAPDWATPEGQEFLNRNVSCKVSGEFAEIAAKYQKHRHSHTCFKNKDSMCRFRFPRPPSEETRILGDEEIHRNGGKFAILERTPDEAMINNYHPILLQVLRCNMDIQPVTGANAVAYYICKYVSKPEQKELQGKVQEAILKIKESPNLTARQKMSRIALQIMKRRQVSAQEAAFRLCHLYLRKSSRATVFLPTYRPEDRIRMLRKETFGQNERQFCLNIIDRYVARPQTPDFQNMCLFEFASEYEPVALPKNTIPQAFDDADVDECAEPAEPQPTNPRIFHLLNGKGSVYRRSQPCVVKTPNFHPVSDREKFYYSLTLMYKPFRDEDEFSTNNFETAEAAFRELHPQFRRHTDNPCINPDLNVEIDQALLRATEFNYDEQSQLNIDEQFSIDFVDDHDVPLTEEEAFPQPPPNIAAEIQEGINKLNSDQVKAFRKFDDKLKSILRNETPGPLRLIINGEGGSGKTFLIKLVTKLIQQLLGKDALLVAAPTGKAAHAVAGLTLHRTFSLPVELDGVGHLRKLGARKLQDLRSLYRNVKFIIIDEMSLINYETLRMIHLRLAEIFESDEPFAGKHICLLGDLLQMKPPRGSYIFQQKKAFGAETHLWRIFDFVELKINERQTGGDPLLGICRRLRIGQITEEDVAVLQGRLLNPINPDYQTKLQDFQDCMWAFPTIGLANRHNSKKSKELHQTLSLQGKKVYHLNAEDTYGDGWRQGKTCDPRIVPKKDSKTAGIPGTLRLGIGSRVMLRRNLDVPSGKVNGATGTVMEFEWSFGRDQNEAGKLPRRIRIKFDHSNQNEWIEPTHADFYGKRNTRIMRRMIPVVEAFGLNHHKLQGVTVRQIVVDLGKKPLPKGWHTLLSVE